MLKQTIEIAEGADELGVNGAYVRVHHFARQSASPMPLLSAIAATTSRIEVGTGVIDMRYENPLYLAEEAASLDLIADGDRGGFAGICEFFQVDAAFHLVADIDDGLARLDGDDLAFDDRTLLRGVDLEAFVQKGLELFHGRFSAHKYPVSFTWFSGLAVGSAGLFVAARISAKGSRLWPDPV